MFALTSSRANVDKSLLKGKGPATYRIYGQSSHLIGSLCYQWLGNRLNLHNFISMTQKMRLETELAGQGNICFILLNFNILLLRFVRYYVQILCVYILIAVLV